MDTVTISPRYQITLPHWVRASLGLQPGRKLLVLLYDNRIELIPVRPVQQMRDFVSGIDTTVEREPDRL